MTEADQRPLLKADDVSKHFGRIRAVDGMHIEVRRGELVGLIGPNGAGKTTFFNCLAGWYRPDSGTIRYRDHDLNRVPAYRIARLGLVRTFQMSRTLARMTVRENLELAPAAQFGERMWAPFVPLVGTARIERDERRIGALADEMLAYFSLDHLADEYAGAVSGGQRKLLELARALMLEPQMLLLDEPLAGVNPTLARHLMERIHDVRDERGITILLIEHDMETIMKNCDRVVVMAEGRHLAEGSPEEVQRNAAVLDAYLGGP